MFGCRLGLVATTARHLFQLTMYALFVDVMYAFFDFVLKEEALAHILDDHQIYVDEYLLSHACTRRTFTESSYVMSAP